jgi:anti-sigma regulatory factor (Ser/Thr protein kinase)
MREIALHLLDIAENSVAAQSRNIRIEVCEDLQHDRLSAIVTDDGRGMDAETVQQVLNPFYTSRTTRTVGLGIPLLKLAAEMAKGELTIASRPGGGTQVSVAFQHSHIDRMPLGDLAFTILMLFVSHADIHWFFGYKVIDVDGAEKEFIFDDTELMDGLDGLSRTEPEILSAVRHMLEAGVLETGTRSARPLELQHEEKSWPL